MNRLTWSLGDIAESKFYVDLEIHRTFAGYCFSIGKTYVGTKAGLVISLGRVSLLAHIR